MFILCGSFQYHSFLHTLSSIMLFSYFFSSPLTHWYQLDQSISVFNVRWYFYFNLDFDRTFCKQTMETLIRHSNLSHLIHVCTVCIYDQKNDATLIWVNLFSVYFLNVRLKSAGSCLLWFCFLLGQRERATRLVNDIQHTKNFFQTGGYT